MSFRLELPETFGARLARAQSPLVGAWVTSGSPTNAEIISNAGFSWVLIDAEHSPYGLETILELLRAIAASPATPVVRLPKLDTALMKQYLDLGAQNLMVPMVNTAEQAQEAVAAMHYPPRGVRGVGSALARSSRWNGVEDYLNRASETVSLTVQIESVEAVENAEAIFAVDGVDQVFVGPSDLAASMGLLGKQTHPEVLEAVARTFRAARDAGKPVGVNAFDLNQARTYLDQGAAFVLVGADVQMLANSARSLAADFVGD
ncbi:HpcH/HpaI aldolase family protein [Corynebacterium mayonis]|uniref:HpcH/HpaI aldolase family protein n=1 Tax=Corynebacterium mayonis TaxID=3062461 RepID=UPI00313FE560